MLIQKKSRKKILCTNISFAYLKKHAKMIRYMKLDKECIKKWGYILILDKFVSCNFIDLLKY